MSNQGSLILTIRFYKSVNGSEPVREWLKTLPKESKKRIGEDIKTVQLGWPLGMPVVRKIKPGLWEVRTHLNAGIARIIFTTFENTMVLLHGFIKKTQKIPQKELVIAKKRKISFEEAL